jgi:hypothetical protein
VGSGRRRNLLGPSPGQATIRRGAACRNRTDDLLITRPIRATSPRLQTPAERGQVLTFGGCVVALHAARGHLGGTLVCTRSKSARGSGRRGGAGSPRPPASNGCEIHPFAYVRHYVIVHFYKAETDRTRPKVAEPVVAITESEIGMSVLTEGASNGRLELHPLGDLTVVEEIQRVPKDSRIKTLGRNGWQQKKQGILLVAKITDGEHAGAYHVYDGGTRYRLGLQTVGESYVMPCWVEDMTLAEAAEKFDIFNSESKKPSPFDHYKVGVAYGEPHQTAIKRALDALGLVGAETSSYGNGRPGEVAALVACKNVALGGYRASKDLPEPDRWQAASDRLVEVLEILRDAYTTADAHDGDMIQAVARVRAQNGVMSEDTRSHFVETISELTSAKWRSLAQSVQEASGSQGGSQSRANFIATLLATEHNKTASKTAMLSTPASKISAIFAA